MDDFDEIYFQRERQFKQGINQGIAEVNTRDLKDKEEQGVIFGQQFAKQVALYQTFSNELTAIASLDPQKYQRIKEVIGEIDTIISTIDYQSLQYLRQQREQLLKKFNLLCAMVGIKKNQIEIESKDRFLIVCQLFVGILAVNMNSYNKLDLWILLRSHNKPISKNLFILVKEKNFYFFNQNQAQQTMSATPTVLNPDQIEELNYMLHGILEENKKSLEDTLSEFVEVENTSVLGLYKLVVQEWGKKQKIVDNLCHFSLTITASVQLLWEQREQQEQRLKEAENLICSIQSQVQELTDINDVYKNRLNEAEVKIDTLAEARQKMEELVKSQSCINFAEQLGTQIDQLMQKKCSACSFEGEQNCKRGQITKQVSEIIVNKENQIQNLMEQNRELEKRLGEAIQESQLTKMQLQLAEIAIKEALTYKSSYKSLLESTSKLTLQHHNNQGHFMHDMDLPADFDTSFTDHNILSEEFRSREDLVHFASTPCLLLNDSINKFDNSASSLREELQPQQNQNPFKKKNQDTIQMLKLDQSQRINQKGNDQMQLGEESFCTSQQPSCSLSGDQRVTALISKFQIKQSHISDRQETQQSSYLSKPKVEIDRLPTIKKMKSEIIEPSSTFSRFYNMLSSKVVRDRIKIK